MSALSWDEQVRMLHEYVPGYAEYAQRRDPVLRTISLQKDDQYSPEEEIRIIHCPDFLNNPLKYFNLRLDDGRVVPRAVLPFAFKQGHLLREIIRTPNCAMSEVEVGAFLYAQGFQVPVRTLPLDALT